MNNILKTLEEYAETHGVPIIRHESALLLQRYVSENQPASILEIGTAIGYSSLLMAKAAPTAKITTIELDEQRASKANEIFSQTGILDRVSLLKGDASVLLTSLRENYDFVFIDAAKGHYLEYLLKIEDKLSPGAVVFADNVLFRGLLEPDVLVPKRYRTIVKRMQQYLHYIESSGKYSTELFNIEDGIAVSHRIV